MLIMSIDFAVDERLQSHLYGIEILIIVKLNICTFALQSHLYGIEMPLY